MTDPVPPGGQPFQEFGDDARRVLAYAREEALGLYHNYVGTEHLLLGLLRDFPGAGARLLRRLGVELDETRAAVEFVIGRGGAPVTGKIGPTPRARRTLAAGGRSGPGAPGGHRLRRRTSCWRCCTGRGPTPRPTGSRRGSERLRGDGRPRKGQLPQVTADEAGQSELVRLAREGRWEEGAQVIAKWRERRRQGRRDSLVLPDELFAEVERLAERQQTTVVELLRRFTRLGLLATQLQERPDAALLIREGGTERQILLL